MTDGDLCNHPTHSVSLHGGLFIQKETMAEQQAMVSQTIHTKTIGLRAEQNGPNSTVMVSSHKQYVANFITDLHQKVNFRCGQWLHH